MIKQQIKLALPVALLVVSRLALQLASGQCLPAPSGLIGWWSGDGHAMDLAGTNNGVMMNGATFDAGVVGSAFSFDGVNDYAQVPLVFANQAAFSFVFWVKVNSFTDQDYMGPFSQSRPAAPDSPGSFNFWTGDSAVGTFGMGGIWLDGSWLEMRVPIPFGAGVWKHVAITYDGNTISQYVDGNLLNSKTDIGKRLGDGTPINLGKAYGYPVGVLRPGFLDGRVDEFLIFGRGLSQSEVQAIYQSGAAGLCKAPLITSQPQGQVGFWGRSVSLTVTAVGDSPMGYHWQKNGVPMLDATNTTMVLNNLQLSDAGSYTVVVSNSVGTVTSAPAYLTVNPAGVNIALYAGVTIDGVVGQTYGIQSTLDLSNTNSWVGRTNLTLTTPTYLWYDSNPATQPQTYYRVLPGPIPIP